MEKTRVFLAQQRTNPCHSRRIVHSINPPARQESHAVHRKQRPGRPFDRDGENVAKPRQSFGARWSSPYFSAVGTGRMTRFSAPAPALSCPPQMTRTLGPRTSDVWTWPLKRKRPHPCGSGLFGCLDANRGQAAASRTPGRFAARII